METFDGVLPNFEELEVAVSFKEQLKKASLASRKEGMLKMLELTRQDIVRLIKKRVSAVGIYDLYDQIQMDQEIK
jgi:hypothetical protein